MSESPLIPIVCFNCNHRLMLRGGKPSHTQTFVCSKCNTDLLNSPIPELEDLLAQCSHDAKWRYALVPHLPPNTSLTVNQLWEETRHSFLLGQYSASLSLSSGFLQHVLEKAIGDKYKAKSLGHAINHAKGKGLIDKGVHKKLDGFRDFIRNRYAHGDHDAISNNFPIQEKTTLRGELSPEDDANATEMVKVLMKERSDIAFARRVLQYLSKYRTKSV